MDGSILDQRSVRRYRLTVTNLTESSKSYNSNA
jgi:hypothetical protein